MFLTNNGLTITKCVVSGVCYCIVFIYICLLYTLHHLYLTRESFSRWLFEIIHIIRFEMRMDSRINLKIFLGYDINYLSIWTFMHHLWFPIRRPQIYHLSVFSSLKCWIISFASKKAQKFKYSWHLVGVWDLSGSLFQILTTLKALIQMGLCK